MQTEIHGLIDGNWYYFNSDGYMAHDTTIAGYYLNSSGAWVSSQTTTSANNYLSSNKYVDNNSNGIIKGSKNYIYHVPGSKYYDKTTNVVQWFKTVEEAEAAGYKAPEKYKYNVPETYLYLKKQENVI